MITDSLSALVLFVLQELTLTQKGYNPITVKTINNGAYCNGGALLQITLDKD
jgi:hypothetical protein